MRLKLIFLLGILFLNFSSFSQIGDWDILPFPTRDALHDIELVNNSVAYTYTYGTGKVYKTTNDGEDWQLIAELDSVYFEQIQFIDKDKGWLVGSPNKVYNTSDGGKTWNARHIIAEENNKLGLVYGMYFTNFNNGFVAVGGKGKSGIRTNIYHTIDGGSNWALINSIPEIIVNIEKVGNAFYGSGKNLIIKNIDKNDFEVVYRDTTGNIGLIRDIEQNKKGEMVAVSDNGFILTQKNNKWGEKKLTSNRVRSLTAFQRNKFVAVGDNNKEQGNLFIGENGGKKWSLKSNQFPDIHRVNANVNYVWVVGKDGFVAKQKIKR